ncbi:MAG: hypothetical protein WA960_21945 [Tunicatimonas sp.]
MYTITLYSSTPPSEALRGFQAAVAAQRLPRTSHELYALGFSYEELHRAVSRAMNACLAIYEPMEQHFQCTYLCHQRTVVPSWRLSETAFRLVVLNANPSHSRVAKFQMRVVNTSGDGNITVI